jgi:hypothetical protein
MKKMVMVLSVVAVVVSGCPGERIVAEQKRQINIPKTFFDRTITYKVDAEAKEYMSKLESLLGHIRQLDAPVSDDIVLPLYRDTDIDRDRHITFAEAKAFYDDYVLRFEDSLGPLCSN